MISAKCFLKCAEIQGLTINVSYENPYPPQYPRAPPLIFDFMVFGAPNGFPLFEILVSRSSKNSNVGLSMLQNFTIMVSLIL